MKLNPGGTVLKTDSNSTTTPKSDAVEFKVYMGRRGVYSVKTFEIELDSSTAGTGKITSFNIRILGFSKEYKYEKYVSGTVDGGTAVAVQDYTSDTKTYCGWNTNNN